MNHVIIFMTSAMLLMLLMGCTVSHEFGPYRGKVVDKETREPIEGAVVFMRFFTEGYSAGGPVSEYADAVEVLTDSNGEFEIPARKVSSFRLLSRWGLHGDVIIFKPSYGCYPEHKGTGPRFVPWWSLPENEYVTIELPKLGTIEERRTNLSYTSYCRSDMPCSDYPQILRLINVERVELGLDPKGIPADGGR